MKNEFKFLIVLIILVVLINIKRRYEPFTTIGEKTYNEEKCDLKKYENAYRLDPTGEIAEYDVSNMEISPNCCPAQYMSETDLQSNNCKFSTEFVANNYSGMNYKDGLGCVCMTPKQATFLGHRGGNA
jgi:hypothetical protein